MKIKQRERRPLTLFSMRDAEPPLDFAERVRGFARATALRGRGPADVPRFLTALVAYHAAWTLCSRTAVPPLDDRARAQAVGAYCEAKGVAKRSAA